MLTAILGPFGLAIALIVHHWDKVKGAVGWVITKVQELWTASEPAREILTRIGGIALTGLKDAIGWVILKVVDLWTFRRDTKSNDPNWLLIKTESEG